MLKAWDDICVVETWSLSFPQVCRKYPCIGGWGGFCWYQPGSNVASIINTLSCERCGSCVWHEGRELRWPGWPQQWHHPGPRHQSGCWYFLDRIPILYHPSKSKKISEPSVMSYSTFVFADCSIGTPFIHSFQVLSSLLLCLVTFTCSDQTNDWGVSHFCAREVAQMVWSGWGVENLRRRFVSTPATVYLCYVSDGAELLLQPPHVDWPF